MGRLVGLALVLLAAGLPVAQAAAPAAPATAVRVPAVSRSTLRGAYAALHRAGFRVRVSRPFTISALCQPGVARQTPAAGTLRRSGALVTLIPSGCALGSPAVPDRLPRATVPRLVGGSVAAAVAWAQRARLSWSVRRLPVLRRGWTPTLLGNYTVTRQTPAPGTVLVLGERLAGGAFRVTPLTVAG